VLPFGGVVVKFSKKFLLIPILAVAIIVGYLYLKKENVTVTERISPNGEAVVQVHEQKSTVENEFPLKMNEGDVQQAIHKMSHQKVLASQKWGAVPLTPERVKRLIQVVEANKKHYKNADLYLGILEKWDKGDFDNVVQAHNTIWDLQGGSIGKAYEKASPEEEMKFIEENFHVKQ
jgi:hypothetical protein